MLHAMLLPVWLLFSWTCCSHAFEQSGKMETKYLVDDNYVDVQSALIAITRKFPQSCSVVLIFDELLPILSVSAYLMQRLQKGKRMFTILNLQDAQSEKLEAIYGSTLREEIVSQFLNKLYRQQECYVFYIWLENPDILYSENALHRKYHPGWRQNDYVIIMAYHFSGRGKYRQLSRFFFWKNIPNVVALRRQSKCNCISIFTVMPYDIGARSNPTQLDIWIVQQKIFSRNRKLFHDKFTNFNTAQVHVGVYWKEPYLIWGDADNPYMDGLDHRLMNLLRRKLNFSVILHFSEGIGYLEDGSNGTWKGIMGKVAKGVIDFGIGGISVTSNRLKYFGFCRTYFTDSFAFISPLKQSEGNVYQNFVQPLSQEVWVCLLVSAGISCLVLKSLAHLEEILTLETNGEFLDLPFTRISHNFQYLIAVISQKTFHRVPISNSLKFAYYGIAICFLIVGLFFSSCLKAYLMHEKPNVSVDKIREVSESKLKKSMENYLGYLNEFMDSNENVDLKKIWQDIELVNAFTNGTSVFDEVVKGLRIHIDSRLKVLFVARYGYVGSEGYKFHIGSENIIDATNIGWPIRKNWPFKRAIDDIIARAVESGLVQYWLNNFLRGKFGWDKEAWKIPDVYKNYVHNKNNRTARIDPTVQSKRTYSRLGLKHYSGLFGFWFAGMLSALFVFTIEVIIGRTKNWCNLYNRSVLCCPKHHKVNSVRGIQCCISSKGANKLKHQPQALMWSDFKKP